MSVKAKVEAIIYATEKPVTLSQLVSLLTDEVLAELRVEDEARLALNETVSAGEPGGQYEAASDAVAEAPPQAEASSRPAYSDGEQLSSEDLTTEQIHEREKEESKLVKDYLSRILTDLTTDYSESDHGVEIRQIAGGYRMGTKPEHHDVVVSFAKSLKPPIRLSLQALETLAVIAYKQPVTVPEISEIRGVDSSDVIATLLDRKLITTAGRKQVIGRPILYKTTKEFLMRFGLNNVAELPSMEEFEKLGDPQAELFASTAAEPESDATDAAAEKHDSPAEPEPVAETAPVEPVASTVDGAEAPRPPDAEA